MFRWLHYFRRSRQSTDACFEVAPFSWLDADIQTIAHFPHCVLSETKVWFCPFHIHLMQVQSQNRPDYETLDRTDCTTAKMAQVLMNVPDTNSCQVPICKPAKFIGKKIEYLHFSMWKISSRKSPTKSNDSKSFADGWWIVQITVRPCFASCFNSAIIWVHEYESKPLKW